MGQDGGEAVDWAAQAEQLTAEFFDAMQRMYIGAGEPALRTVAARNNRLSASNLSALFSGRRTALPNYEVMTAVVDALLHGAPTAEREQEHARWKQRWADVRYATKQAKKAAAEQDRQAADTLAEAERVLAEARAKADNLLAEARLAAGREQVRERQLTERRQQVEAEVNEMTARAEKIRVDTEEHRAQILEAARAEVEANRDRIATETAQAIEHVRIETENMRTAAHAEAEKTRKAAQDHALEIVEQARRDAEEEMTPLRVQVKALYSAAQKTHDQAHAAAQQLRVDTEADVEAMRMAAREEVQRMLDEVRREVKAANIPRATGDGATVEQAMAAEISAIQNRGIELTPTFTDDYLLATAALGAHLPDEPSFNSLKYFEELYRKYAGDHPPGSSDGVMDAPASLGSASIPVGPQRESAGSPPSLSWDNPEEHNRLI